MAKKKRKKRGPPARYGYRPTLTVRLQIPLYERIKEAAAAHGKSLSEEIEDRLGLLMDTEFAQRDLEQTRRIAAKEHAMAAGLLANAAAERTAARAERTAARVQLVRAAGLVVLREAEGRPSRVVVEFETLMAEADGIARALRSGFVDPENPPRDEVRKLTAEEEQRLLAELDEVRRKLDASVAATLAADKAADDETAA
jgi:hypothetical protein